MTFHNADVEAYRKATAGFYSSFPKWPAGLYDKVGTAEDAEAEDAFRHNAVAAPTRVRQGAASGPGG